MAKDVDTVEDVEQEDGAEQDQQVDVHEPSHYVVTKREDGGQAVVGKAWLQGRWQFNKPPVFSLYDAPNNAFIEYKLIPNDY